MGCRNGGDVLPGYDELGGAAGCRVRVAWCRVNYVLQFFST